ncbi:MAG: hypothetical protein PHR16_13980 [Methylovulum sp.]|nr:hypothetical protein [Methylovulum sp.]
MFGWSFYSQGSHNTFTNSQPFFSAVLPFLGISEIPKDEIEKARLLAQECQKQPCLLILDGLEPLQYAPNLAAMNGELQDSALIEFILQFRKAAGKSFVLFSSRQPLVEVTEKNRWHKENYLELNLKTLPHDDGADLLQAVGVTGKAAERQAISQDLSGHALSLVLMGHLLSEYHEGDPRYAKELPPLTEAYGNSDAEKDSRHALRVLDYYDGLQDDASRRFLQLLGLFDRPMNREEKAVLIANAEHAQPLRALTVSEWKKVEQKLEKNGLLLGQKGSFGHLEWDTHPIIRSYFGEKFKEKYPEEFKQAHLVLFEYFHKLPEKKFREIYPDTFENFESYPATFEEIQPYFRAVIHGCLAGEYCESKWIYERSILRGNKQYNIIGLGAYSETLTALSAFFPSGWKESNNNFNEEEQALLLDNISFCLMSLGRLQDTLELKKISKEFYDAFIAKVPQIDNWINTSSLISGLVELNILLGNIAQAESFAQKAIEYAKRSRSFESRKRACLIGKTCELAAVLSYRGKLKEACEHFKQAEKLEHDSEYQLEYLNGISNFFYCSLLLDIARDEINLKKIIERTNYSLEIEHIEREGNLNVIMNPKNLLSIALNNLILANVYFALDDTVQSESYFQQSIQDIEKARTIAFKPIFYLYRADFYLTQNQLENADADLNSALEIIERCGMKLYQVDYCLIHGRYCLATADFDSALIDYKEAKNLIQETGYHLRDAELDLLAARICRSTKHVLYSKDANDYLQKAKSRIEEIGQWGLWRVIERDFPDFAANNPPTFEDHTP